MENNKRLALEIGLVAVIIYLWLNRQKKCKAVEEAKAGANVAPTENTAKNGECGSVSSDCMGTDTSKKSQLEKTVTVAETTANFSGESRKGIKAQYFR